MKKSGEEPNQDKQKKQKSILAQISKVQNALEEHYYRVDVLEKALQYKEMTSEEREAMEAELEAIKNVLSKNEEALKDLHAENRKTSHVAFLFIFLCVAIFLVYTVLTNTI